MNFVFPAKFALFSNFLPIHVYSGLSIVMGNRGIQLTTENTLKQNGDRSGKKTNLSKVHFPLVMASSRLISHFWKMPLFTWKRHRVNLCFLEPK